MSLAFIDHSSPPATVSAMTEGREQRNAREDGSSQTGSDDASPWRKIALIIFGALVVFALTAVLWANRQRGLQQLIADLSSVEAALFLTLIFIVVALLVYFVAKRTLWELLQLLSALAIPIVLAAAGFWFTEQQEQRQLQIEEQRAQDAALQAYLDQMGALVLEHDLRNSEADSKVGTLARARTVTVIQRLDADGNRNVIRFLKEANLTGRGTFQSTGQSSTSLLAEADLQGARFEGVDLSDINLRVANLNDAHLRGAILDGTNLRGATGITNEELEQQAASFEGATMPNGQKYEEWIKARGEDGENPGASS
jgi:hypothetical protein